MKICVTDGLNLENVEKVLMFEIIVQKLVECVVIRCLQKNHQSWNQKRAKTLRRTSAKQNTYVHAKETSQARNAEKPVKCVKHLDRVTI